MPCPKSANRLISVTYTWIDTRGNPINLPAPQYIKNILTWVSGKAADQSIFPSDNFTQAPPLPRVADLANDPNHWLGKTSGFPQRFESEVKNMYRQMFRCYAHLYWQHWITFWELSANRDLNTCFVHFINVGRIFNLLTDKDMEPMLPLVELWIKEGVMPKRETENLVNNGDPPKAPVAPNSAGGSAGAGDASNAQATGAAGSSAGPGIAL